MRKRLKLFLICLTIIAVALVPLAEIRFIPIGAIAEAHSGRTDSSGGHKDNKNKSGLGSYHYHCGGNPPHLHDNGVCPYSSQASNSSNSKKSTTKKSTSTNASTNKATIKKVQVALNELGYDCGKADGKLGKKTKEALRAFQEDNNLTIDGKIGKEVKEALNIK